MVEYLIGKGANKHGIPVWVGYRVDGKGDPEVAVCMHAGRHADGPVLPPEQMLEFAPRIYCVREVDGKKELWPTNEHEPSGWFGSKCAEANCSWFVPLVERMATGEEVALEEIEAAYREHSGGKEMPRGIWWQLAREGYQA